MVYFIGKKLFLQLAEIINGSKTAERTLEYVKRRKISGGTRNEEGRRDRDTFASLKKTCRKLNVSFWKFLNDRVRSKNQIPQLPALIAARAQAQ